MLKLSQKRPRDWQEMSVDPCPSFAPSPSFLQTPSKRIRFDNGSMNIEGRTSPIRGESSFIATNTVMNSSDVEDFTKVLPHRSKPKPTTNERLFTFEEVREIVNRLL